MRSRSGANGDNGDRGGNGGMVARRAVVRWAVRVLRREWRQQVLMLAVLGLAVAAATGSVSAAYNVVPLRAAEFGSGEQRLVLDGSDPRVVEANIAAAQRWFGTIDVIAHEAAAVRGSVEPVDIRAQDPNGPYGTPMLRLRQGRYPTRAGEMAVTDDVAKRLGVDAGASVVLEGRARTVVGLVENPSGLGDEFALVSPSSVPRPESVTVLVRATPDRADAFRDVGGGRPMLEARGRTEKDAAAAGALGLATLMLLLISFVAAAGFTVVAQRRLRQLGMLAAIGATEKHLRLVMLANGTLVGVIAAVTGAATGLVLWLAAAPWLEPVAAHRIGRLDLPWPLIGLGMVLAVVTATAAASWPARAAARVPVTRALSARPPRPKPAHRSAWVGGLLTVAGVACLGLSDQANGLLIIVGIVAVALGVLFVSPLAIRALVVVGGRAPIAVRLALRDLGRYQARSGAALAAIGLALGIAVTVVVIATAAQWTAAEGNLSDRQVLFRGGDGGPLLPDRSAAELQPLRAAVDRFAATLDRPAVTALELAVDPTAEPEPAVRGGPGGRPVVTLAKRVGAQTHRRVGELYVATPELLAHLRLDAGAIDRNADVLAPARRVTAQTGGQSDVLSFVNVSNRSAPVPNVQTVDVPAYSSAPATLITPQGLRRGGWQSVPAAWLVETPRPLTGVQLEAARDMAADAGMTVEARRDQRSLGSVRSGATAAGMLLALGVLAMTVGLIRTESAGDLRTLTATGATSASRRALTATTAGALGLLGVLLGTAGAYVGLIGGYVHELSQLSRVPVLHLAATIVGVPLVATLAGWCVAGREPTSFARRALE